MAPIFTKGAKSKPASPDDGLEITKVETEQDKKKKAFLLSGVPEEMKKQTELLSQASSLEEFTPFPVVNHVQQLGDNVKHKNGAVTWKEKVFDEQLNHIKQITKGELKISLTKENVERKTAILFKVCD